MVERASVRGTDADRADDAKTWDELMSGRWRIVELFDVDGRRHVVAQRRTGDPISPLERLVLERRAHGEGLKVIAMDLGLSEATISRRLRGGMQKLGVCTHAQLACLFVR